MPPFVGRVDATPLLPRVAPGWPCAAGGVDPRRCRAWGAVARGRPALYGRGDFLSSPPARPVPVGVRLPRGLSRLRLRRRDVPVYCDSNLHQLSQEAAAPAAGSVQRAGRGACSSHPFGHSARHQPTAPPSATRSAGSSCWPGSVGRGQPTSTRRAGRSWGCPSWPSSSASADRGARRQSAYLRTDGAVAVGALAVPRRTTSPVS
jgi:hypothetical protein